MSPVSPTKSDHASPPDPSHEVLSQTATTKPRTSSRLLIQSVAPCSKMQTNSPTSPHSIRFPYSPIPTDSPINPFLIPPQPRLITTTMFRLAAPLLPASPLSTFDRTISPTSLGAIPSPTSPGRQQEFMYAATPYMEHKDTYKDLTTTFLWPRIPPRVPQRIRKNSRLASSEMKCEDQKILEEDYTTVDSCVGIDAAEHIDAIVPKRSKMRLELDCSLTANQGAAIDQTSSPPSPESSEPRSARKSWKELFLKSKGTGKEPVSNRRSRLMCGGHGDRA